MLFDRCDNKSRKNSLRNTKILRLTLPQSRVKIFLRKNSKNREKNETKQSFLSAMGSELNDFN